MPTIKDIAQEAGVSYSTVSIVLGRRSDNLPISEATQKKVRDTANRLGYHRNALAGEMKTGKSKTFSFIIFDAGMEYVSRICISTVERAQEDEYTCKLHTFPLRDIPTNREKIVEYYNSILEMRPAGLIVNSKFPCLEFLLDSCRELGIPTVSAGHRIPECELSVYSDSRAGEILAIEYLCRLGCSKIGFISDPLSNEYVGPRLEGYRAAVRKLGISGSPELQDPAMIPAVLKHLKESGHLPEAFACSSDYLALRTIMSAMQLGIRVPEDLLVIGFAGLNFIHHANPTISSVNQDFEQIGRTVAGAIIDYQRSGKFREKEILIPCRVQEEQSTRKDLRGERR